MLLRFPPNTSEPVFLGPGLALRAIRDDNRRGGWPSPTADGWAVYPPPGRALPVSTSLKREVGPCPALPAGGAAPSPDPWLTPGATLSRPGERGKLIRATLRPNEKARCGAAGSECGAMPVRR